MKSILISAFLVLSITLTHAQNVIKQRIILIGDAGELDQQQNAVLSSAAAQVIKNKSTVFYLGDNIYPVGMGLPGSPDEESTKKILQAQYQPMRAAGAAVYFIPGNHDWDRMGPKGLAKVKRQWEFLGEQKDSLLKAIPKDGCPDPTAINLGPDVTVIAFDSEWWLHIYNKDNPNADCDCNSNEEIINRFEELLYNNRNKVIILADHHPFKTYGHHGGSYIWQDYVFPLTSVNRHLYIPLPVIGALYPFLRKNFDNPEDNGHPLYKTMISQIESVFKGDPNVIYASGHEHGLQFIKDDDRIQVVSGSGAKRAAVKKGNDALYAESLPGYVTIDIMDDKSAKFTYYASKTDSNLVQVFTYTKPFVPITIPVPKIYSAIKGDSVKVQAYGKYDSVSRVHRWLYGENYRKEWAATATVPIIRISDFKGGLTPVRFGGAHQTQSLLLTDKQGKEWIMSNIEKYPRFELPQALRQTFAHSWFNDAMSAQHPYAAIMSPVLANAVKVAHTKPTIGWVAPDHKLGFYEKNFAGSLVLIEEREPGDSSINTGVMLKNLDSDYHNHVDTTEFFRARLLDWFLGDWDRHQDEWRWIGVKKGTETYYTSVPHDRAEVFYINQGLIPRIASRQWVARFLKGYSGGPKSISDFYFNDHTLNVRFLTSINHEKWIELTQKFADALTDAVLEEALKKLPLNVYKFSHDKLLLEMKKRRDKLLTASEIYYKFFNRTVDIKATDKSELVTIKDTVNGGIDITIDKLPAERKKYNTIFHRSFDPAVTKEIRLYISKGDDSVYVNTTSHIKLRIIGGNGHKLYNFEQANRRVNVYEKLNTATFTGNSNARVDKHLSNDTSNVGYIPTNEYNTIIPLLKTGYDIDNGYYADAGFKYLHQGFRKQPGSTQQFLVGRSFATDANRLSYTGEWNSAIHKADAEIKANIFLPTSINFFGRGNQTSFVKSGDYFDYYRSRFSFFTLDATLRFRNKAGVTSLRLGPSVQYYHPVSNAGGRLIDNSNLIHTYDSTTIGKDKMHIGFVATYINDKRNNALLPAWGVYVYLRVQSYAGVGSYARSFAQFTPHFELYKSFDAASNFVLAEKLGGGITIGKTTYYQSMFLGGEEHMIGYKENRFAGQHMFYNNLETRIKLSGLLPYILPGQFGVTGFYDIGRVWIRQEKSATWHNGFGAGAYFSPADMALVQVKAGYSKEGWYPYANLTFTF